MIVKPLEDPMIRPTIRGDLEPLKSVIDATGLFPSRLLEGMIAPFLDASPCEEWWLTALADDEAVAVAYYAPERMTEGTWNLLLIAVHPERQQQGIGAALVRRIENTLAAGRARILLVETSGLPAFEGTRAFYHRIGYVEEARISDFYQTGEDKVIFLKKIQISVSPRVL